MKTVPGFPDQPIGSIFCIGRNYQKHAEELGNTVPDRPMVFLKPASAVIGNGEAIELPAESREIHHEVELVIAIGKTGKNIAEENALQFVAGYGIGIDVTARDMQQKAKGRGHPWSVAKGFDTFAPLSHFKPITSQTDFSDMKLALSVNDEVRQRGTTRNMIFPAAGLIAYLSTIFTLQPGDLIFTGTPEGVSEIKNGDRIHTSLNDNEIELEVSVIRSND